MKVDGTSSTLQYSSSYWTDNQLLNSDTSNMNVNLGGNAKFRAFTTAPGVAVRLMMRKVSSGSSFGTPVDLYTGPFTSLTALFKGPTLTTSADKSTWLSILPGGISYQDYCNYQGVNVQVPGLQTQTFRLGIFFNDQNDCNTCDSAAGIGGGGNHFDNVYSLISSEAFYAGRGTVVNDQTTPITTYSNLLVKQCAIGQRAITVPPFCLPGMI